MLKKSVVIASLSLIAMCTSIEAAAQTYVGATVGKAKWSGSCFRGGYACSQAAGTSTAFKIFGGYELTPHWGAELSYYNMGDLNSRQSKGIDAAAVLRFPFGASNLNGFIKMGLAYDHGQVRGYTEPDTSFQPVIGLGLNYKLSETLSARFDFESRHTSLSSTNDQLTSYTSSVNFGLIRKF